MLSVCWNQTKEKGSHQIFVETTFLLLFEIFDVFKDSFIAFHLYLVGLYINKTIHDNTH